MAGVTVKIYDKNGKYLGGCKTDANGEYLIKDIPNGKNHKMTFTYPGFEITNVTFDLVGNVYLLVKLSIAQM